MTTILSDHDIEGQAEALWRELVEQGWLELITVRLVTFDEVGLAHNSSDRAVWRFAQTNQMILLTANRQMKELDSLEQTIRDENTADSLPVLTLSNAIRMKEREYRVRCVERVVVTVTELNNYKGVGRLFIP